MGDEEGHPQVPIQACARAPTRADNHGWSAPNRFPTRLAAAAGLTQDQLRSKRWATPFHGVRVDRSDASDLTDGVPRAGRGCPRSIGHQRPSPRPRSTDGGCQRGFDSVVDISVAPGGLIERAGVRCHRRILDPKDVRQLDGIALTSPVRTILDLASQLSLIDLVVVMDSALHKRTCTREQLVARSQDRGVRGIARFRRRYRSATAVASRRWRR